MSCHTTFQLESHHNSNPSNNARSTTAVTATTEQEVTAQFEHLRAYFASQPRFAEKQQRLLDCTLAFETSRSRHGCYDVLANKVLINRENLAKGLAFVDETLRHELAHVISPPVKKASANGKMLWEQHGPAWRAVAQQLGCEYVGKRRPGLPVSGTRERPPKYFLLCNCRNPNGSKTKWFVKTDRGIAKYQGAVPLTCSRCRTEFIVWVN